MFLQATTTIINNKVTEKQVFSLWDVLFSGGIIGNTIMIAIFLLGILALYVFFERYFFIKRASKETPNFLENIKDCIHDGRIQSAIDLCRRTDSPEAYLYENELTFSKDEDNVLQLFWQGKIDDFYTGSDEPIPFKLKCHFKADDIEIEE